MKPPETIRVTAEHIAKGERLAAERCPIALAICEQWSPGQSQASVWASAVASVPGGESWSATLSADDFRWLEEFDRGKPVEPFELELSWRRSS